MSDSDDTDLLLVIPPDFFSVKPQQTPRSLSPKPISGYQSDLHSIRPAMQASFRNELDCLNKKLKSLEKEYLNESNMSSNFDDLNVNTIDRYVPTETSFNDVHQKISFSTPYSIKKQRNSGDRIRESGGRDYSDHEMRKDQVITTDTENFLDEIESYLEDSVKFARNEDLYRKTNGVDVGLNEYQSVPKYTDEVTGTLNGDIRSRAREAIRKHNSIIQQTSIHSNVAANVNPKSNEPLMSLTDIWASGTKRPDEYLSLQEERMRREHCEKTIQQLQTQLLEYQQKISVAIKVDQSKDHAIRNTKELKRKIIRLQEMMTEMDTKYKLEIDTMKHEDRQSKEKIHMLEQELLQAISMARKFQERNDTLEGKIEQLSVKAYDTQEKHKRQLDEQALKLSNEKLENDRIKLELDQLKTEKQATDDIKYELEELREKNRNSYEQIKEEKSRNDLLTAQKQSQQEIIVSLNEKEKNLLKELEAQRISLKSFYQNQLEQVVEHKLKEFQKQMDFLEDTLRTESKQRERTIAERALKQMELINQKNEQECFLLNEKHNEEMSLFRIQLMNATKTISELQGKLNFFQSKRADIAERLQNVMETQWQKAMEIISSPTTRSNFNVDPTSDSSDRMRPIDTSRLDKNKADGIAGLLHLKQHRLAQEPTTSQRIPAENDNFETPTSSHYHQSRSISNDRKDPDKLQAYIDYLLKTSPRDLNTLDEIFTQSGQNINSSLMEGSRFNSNRIERPCIKKEAYQCGSTGSDQQTQNSNKPPWK